MNCQLEPAAFLSVFLSKGEDQSEPKESDEEKPLEEEKPLKDEQLESLEWSDPAGLFEFYDNVTFPGTARATTSAVEPRARSMCWAKRRLGRWDEFLTSSLVQSSGAEELIGSCSFFFGGMFQRGSTPCKHIRLG